MPNPVAPDHRLEFAIKVIIENPSAAPGSGENDPDQEALVALAWQDIDALLEAGAEVNGAGKHGAEGSEAPDAGAKAAPGADDAADVKVD